MGHEPIEDRSRTSPVGQELRDLIREQGRITFAQYMQTCLYSRNGGFYAARRQRINAHFGTAPTSHPAFGALIARQLEQMWHLLDEPPIFQVVEVGCGDCALARSIVESCARFAPEFARTLSYVAADYAPFQEATSFPAGTGYAYRVASDKVIQCVKSEGLRAFRGVQGCILSNELIDNLPVHRFAVQDDRLMEVFVTLVDGNLAEVLDTPSTPRIEQWLKRLGVVPPRGYRGEVCLAMEDWVGQIVSALQRGFALTIDYGLLAHDFYGPDRAHGNLMSYRAHASDSDPYRNPGGQDITCLVDFTSLMQLGEQYGLATTGYTLESRFLGNLGFRSFLDELDRQDMTDARKMLGRLALNALVDPEEYGDFKVLCQAKNVATTRELLGFSREPTRHSDWPAAASLGWRKS